MENDLGKVAELRSFMPPMENDLSIACAPSESISLFWIRVSLTGVPDSFAYNLRGPTVEMSRG